MLRPAGAAATCHLRHYLAETREGAAARGFTDAVLAVLPALLSDQVPQGIGVKSAKSIWTLSVFETLFETPKPGGSAL